MRRPAPSRAAPIRCAHRRHTAMRPSCPPPVSPAHSSRRAGLAVLHRPHHVRARAAHGRVGPLLPHATVLPAGAAGRAQGRAQGQAQGRARPQPRTPPRHPPLRDGRRARIFSAARPAPAAPLPPLRAPRCSLRRTRPSSRARRCATSPPRPARSGPRARGGRGSPALCGKVNGPRACDHAPPHACPAPPRALRTLPTSCVAASWSTRSSRPRPRSRPPRPQPHSQPGRWRREGRRDWRHGLCRWTVGCCERNVWA
jgi:hypothetical protein